MVNFQPASTAQQAALALHSQLSTRFGPTSVFLDVSAIQAGNIWPDRLRSALKSSTVLLSVIGPRWLKAANQYGQRRLDNENDWVRNEIAYPLSNQIPIIPLFVAGGSLPPEEGLPPDIQGLLKHQSRSLRDDSWGQDVGVLIKMLGREYGFVDNQANIILPSREVTISPLTSAELEHALAQLPGWEPVESVIRGDYPNSRHELRKVFRFKSFKAAVGFMNNAVSRINKLQHHPRWENQWRSVTVYLSTWDIDNQISTLDIELAKELDEMYATKRSSQQLTNHSNLPAEVGKQIE